MQQCLPFAVLKLGNTTIVLPYAVLLLQQCLPFAVLKRDLHCINEGFLHFVATVLTVCGIETFDYAFDRLTSSVATVLTVCGIETVKENARVSKRVRKLQQCLPFAVLKPPYNYGKQFSLLLGCNSAYRLRY